MNVNLIRTGALILTLALVSCKKTKNEEKVIVLPTVTTNVVSSITAFGAVCGGNVTDDGGARILEKGVCYSQNPNPTTNDFSTNEGSGSGSFTSTLNNVAPNTTYYVRAYARNQSGTAYGNQQSFVASSASPVVITTGFSNIKAYAADCSANVTSDGGAGINERGFCYSAVNSSPDLTNFKQTAGFGTGTYSVTLTSLNSNTTYYFRSYAINSFDTAYGNVFSFITNPGIGDAHEGGIIAYILQPSDVGYDPTTEHGLIASTADQSSAAPWSLGLNAVGGTTQAYGSGAVNTANIVGNQGVGTYAAKLCDDLTDGGFTDWHLPSSMELEKLYLNRLQIGGFATSFYWSSSEDNINGAWLQSFNSNSQTVGTKTSNYYVRAVRYY